MMRNLNKELQVPTDILSLALTKKYRLSEEQQKILFNDEALKDIGNNGNFPQSLRAFRLSKLLTHNECAEQLQIDPSTVLDWEKGRHKPTKKMVQKIREKIQKLCSGHLPLTNNAQNVP